MIQFIQAKVNLKVNSIRLTCAEKSKVSESGAESQLNSLKEEERGWYVAWTAGWKLQPAMMVDRGKSRDIEIERFSESDREGRLCSLTTAAKSLAAWWNVSESSCNTYSWLSKSSNEPIKREWEWAKLERVNRKKSRSVGKRVNLPSNHPPTTTIQPILLQLPKYVLVRDRQISLFDLRANP